MIQLVERGQGRPVRIQPLFFAAYLLSSSFFVLWACVCVCLLVRSFFRLESITHSFIYSLPSFPLLRLVEPILLHPFIIVLLQNYKIEEKYHTVVRSGTRVKRHLFSFSHLPAMFVTGGGHCPRRDRGG